METEKLLDILSVFRIRGFEMIFGIFQYANTQNTSYTNKITILHSCYCAS
jgi:hypothetical protein